MVAFPYGSALGSLVVKRSALALAAVLLFATPAQARTRVAKPPRPIPMPAITKAPCPGFGDEAAGCFYGAGDADAAGRSYPRGEIFTDGDHFTTLHELGHAFDETMMDDNERHAFAHLLIRPDEYWTASYTDEAGRFIQSPTSLAETFADAYANCRLGRSPQVGKAWEASGNYYPTLKDHRRICGLIARAGRDLGQPAGPDGVAEPVEVSVQ